MTRGAELVAQGSFAQGTCDAVATNWCGGEANVHVWLTPAEYTLTLERAQMCANAASGGQGFVSVYGVWKSQGQPPVNPGSPGTPGTPSAPSSGTIGAAGGAVSGGGATITAPAGAFPAASTVEIRALGPSPQAEEGDLSGWFAVTGIPDEPAAPIELKVPVSRQPQEGGEV